MSKQTKDQHLVDVKTALADKYERLAKARSSKPGKARLMRRAERFRSQAANAAKGSKK